MELRKYTQTEGRDPSVLLGIDGSTIPFEYFEGIYKDNNLIFTDDLFGNEFRVTNEGVIFHTYKHNPDHYVLAEDLKNKDWFLLGSWYVSEYGEESTSDSSQFVFMRGHNELYKKVLKRYQSGETGKIEAREKVYNKAGDWMSSVVIFDTEQGDKLVNRIDNHVQFIFRDFPWIPWNEREMTLRASKKILERIQEEVLKPMLASLFYIENSEGMNINSAMIIGIGKIFFVEDESIEGIIIEKNGEE